MRAYDRNFYMIFGNQVHYRIPEYQRRYVWQEDQWQDLWRDAKDMADILSAHQPGEPDPLHFLGAVVVQEIPGDPSSLLVIDGQQRLTTVQLLINALIAVFENWQPESVQHMLELYARNQIGSTAEDRLKVWPSIRDRKVFERLMLDRSEDEDPAESNIVHAYEFFKENVEDWLKIGGDDIYSKVSSIQRAILYCFQLAYIILEAHEDQQIIFETMNSRGTPLSQSEQIRNMAMDWHGGVNSRGEDIERVWQEFDTDDWWSLSPADHSHTDGTAISPFGTYERSFTTRENRPYFDDFMHHWVTLVHGEQVDRGQVYSTFRQHARERTEEFYATTPNRAAARAKAMESIMSTSLAPVGRLYKQVLSGMRPDYDSVVIRRLTELDAHMFLPVILHLLNAHADERWLRRSLSALDSVFMRHKISGTTVNLLRGAPNVLATIAKNDGNEACQRLIDHLNTSPVIGFPAIDTEKCEQEFKRLRYSKNNAKRRALIRIIFEEIERAYRRVHKTETLTVSDANLTLEHIMPQSAVPDTLPTKFEHWEAYARSQAFVNWPAHLADPIVQLSPDWYRHNSGERQKIYDLLAERKDDLIDNIGNLTLLTEDVNKEADNLSWGLKRSIINRSSNLFINQTLVEDHAEYWDNAHIKRRRDGLWQAINGIWSMG